MKDNKGKEFSLLHKRIYLKVNGYRMQKQSTYPFSGKLIPVLNKYTTHITTFLL